MGFIFAAGQFHPPWKKLQNSLVHHRSEAINSGSRWLPTSPRI